MGPTRLRPRVNVNRAPRTPATRGLPWCFGGSASPLIFIHGRHDAGDLLDVFFARCFIILGHGRSRKLSTWVVVRSYRETRWHWDEYHPLALRFTGCPPPAPGTECRRWIASPTGIAVRGCTGAPGCYHALDAYIDPVSAVSAIAQWGDTLFFSTRALVL